MPVTHAGNGADLLPAWEAAIPDDVLAIETLPASELPALDVTSIGELPALRGGWRIEVTRQGKYWQWRKGSKDKRQSRYGGSIHSHSKGRRNMSRTKRSGKARKLPVITQGEALEILVSAIGYCQQSGLKVRAGNSEGGLVIVVNGAHVASTEGMTRFCAGNAPVVASTSAQVASNAG